MKDGGASENKHIIIKHCVFKNKVKPNIFKRLCYGEPKKLTFTHPKIGLKVWQYCFSNLGGNLFLCFELSVDVKDGGDKNSVNLNDKTDEEIDTGFEYLERETKGLFGLRWLC